MKMSRSMLMTALICGSFGMLASAYAANTESGEEPGNFYLDQIVVTASRVEQKVFDTQANITVITRKKLDERHYTDLGDALKDVPGVTLQNYGASGENYTSNRLYINGTGNIIVLIDGMRANTNGNASTVLSPSEFSNLDVVERIEVLKGSAATLYGSDAEGGVINIITRKASSPGMKTTLGFTGGSYNKIAYRLLNRGNADGFYWMAAAQRNKMGNFKDAHANLVTHKVDSKSYDLMLGKDFWEDSSVTFKYNKYLSDYQRPNSGGIDMSALTTNYGKKDNDRYSLQWNQKINDKVKNTLNLYRNNNHLDDNFTNASGRWRMDMATSGISDQITFEDSHNVLIGGFEFYKDKLNYGYGSGKWADKFDRALVTNRDWFLQETYKFGNGFNITPGIRHTDSSAASKTTKSIGIGYNNGKANIYAGYKEFFKVPGLYQLHSASYGNPDLKPDDGRTIEGGINYAFEDKFLMTFNIYRTKADNIVAFDMGTYHYANIANEKTYGWSIGAHKAFDENWSANINYTHTRIPSADGTKYDNRDGYIPRGEMNIGIDYTFNRYNVNLTGRALFDRPGRKANTDKRPDGLKSFSLWDLTFNYKTGDRFRGFVKINNLFNKWYTDQLYNMDPGSNGWYSAPGRHFQAGIEYTF